MTNTKRGPGLHHIAVRTSDFDASLRFYAQLDFSNAYEWQSGETHIALLDAGDGNYLELISGVADANSHADGILMHVALRCDSADEMYERALQAGATTHVAPKTVELQGRGALSQESVSVRLAFVRGLNGEIIEFFENDVL